MSNGHETMEVRNFVPTNITAFIDVLLSSLDGVLTKSSGNVAPITLPHEWTHAKPNV